jgi:hypothetical protein
MSRVKETGQGPATESSLAGAPHQPESSQSSSPLSGERWVCRRLRVLSLDGWAVTTALLVALLVRTGVIKRIPW